jgi:hypothetical protein
MLIKKGASIEHIDIQKSGVDSGIHGTDALILSNDWSRG